MDEPPKKAKFLEDVWSKIVREHREIHETDRLHGRRLLNGELFNVRFPDGEIKQLATIVTRQAVLVDGFISLQEKVYFAVPYRELPSVWVRGIDVEVKKLF